MCTTPLKSHAESHCGKRWVAQPGTLIDMAEKVKRKGRIRQMIEVYQATKPHDPMLPWILLALFLSPIALGVLAAWLIPGGWLNWVLWPVSGLLLGLLLTMIVLGRRAERVAYRQIAGQPGAVGAVVQGALRRSWRGSETPVALNRNQDAIYRVVGRGGIVIISEGSFQRTRRMSQDEERKVRRALRNVEIVHLYVGTDPGGVPIERLSKTLTKLKPKLSRAEVQAVYNRLSSLQATPIGIPKGIDPNKVRAPRPR